MPSDPQKHHPRIDFPTRYLSFGETLRANCTTAPALPAPHITWFINGKKVISHFITNTKRGLAVNWVVLDENAWNIHDLALAEALC